MAIYLKEGIIFVISAVLAIYWLIKLVMMLWRMRIDPVLSTDPVEIESSPLISIVLAVRDEEKDIGDCIISLQGQDYTNREIVIVDDRSRDGTVRIIERFQKDDPCIRLV